MSLPPKKTNPRVRMMMTGRPEKDPTFSYKNFSVKGKKSIISVNLKDKNKLFSSFYHFKQKPKIISSMLMINKKQWKMETKC